MRPTASPDDDRAWVTLARVVRPRGRIGEVAAEILTDFPERLTKLKTVYLLDPAGLRRSVRIARCWLATSRGGQAIFHFAGVDSIDDAKKLVGCQVQIPLADRAPLSAGRHYVTDLIGCQVVEVPPAEDVIRAPQIGRGGASAPPQQVGKESGALAPEGIGLLGTVRDVYFESGTPLLVVTSSAGELFIPLAEEICTRIDTAARCIEVRLPPGLRELNAPNRPPK